MSAEHLPPKQREVLETILDFIAEHSYPPSIQQLCARCGVSSTSTMHYHISALKKKGFIHWNPSEKRAITVRADLMAERNEEASREPKRGTLPLLGAIAAGSPLQTLHDTAEELDVAEDLYPKGCYALKVRGYSMIEDHILDGDLVVINPKARVREGDVVVALVEGQTATLKRIYHQPDGMIRLQPANAEMEPILVHEVEVQGKVEAILRKMV